MSKYKGQRCDACFKHTADTQLKNCSRCLQAWYCDKNCQKSDWFLHKYECPVFAKHPTSRVDSPDNFFPIFLRAVLLFKSNPSAAAEKHRLFNGHEEVAFQDLKIRQVDSMKFGGLIFERYVQHCKDVFRFLCGKAEKRFFSRLTVSIHRIGVPSSDRPDLLDSVANGVYLERILFEHSCTPSMFVKFDGNKMLMFAAKKIEVGEELTFASSFIELCHETIVRQQFGSFIKSYCKCQRCQVEIECDYNDKPINYFEVEQFRVVSLDWQCFPFFRMQLGIDLNALTIINKIYPYHHPEKTALLVKLVKANAKLSSVFIEKKIHKREREFLFLEVKDGKNPLSGFGTDEAVRLAIEALKVTHPNDELVKFDVDKSDVKEMTDYLVEYDKIK